MQTTVRHFSLVVCNPCYVYGPIIHYVERLEDLNTSVKFIADYITGTASTTLPIASGFVDVRDVATAHVRALSVLEAGGKRIVISGGNHTHVALIEILKRKWPKRTDWPMPPATALPKPLVEVNRLSKELLGLEYHGFEECILDTVESLKELVQKGKSK